MDSDFVKVQKKDRTSGLDGCGGAVPNFATLAELELELVDERRFALAESLLGAGRGALPVTRRPQTVSYSCRIELARQQANRHPMSSSRATLPATISTVCILLSSVA